MPRADKNANFSRDGKTIFTLKKLRSGFVNKQVADD